MLNLSPPSLKTYAQESSSAERAKPSPIARILAGHSTWLSLILNTLWCYLVWAEVYSYLGAFQMFSGIFMALVLVVICIFLMLLGFKLVSFAKGTLISLSQSSEDKLNDLKKQFREKPRFLEKLIKSKIPSPRTWGEHYALYREVGWEETVGDIQTIIHFAPKLSKSHPELFATAADSLAFHMERLTPVALMKHNQGQMTAAGQSVSVTSREEIGNIRVTFEDVALNLGGGSLTGASTYTQEAAALREKLELEKRIAETLPRKQI